MNKWLANDLREFKVVTLNSLALNPGKRLKDELEKQVSSIDVPPHNVQNPKDQLLMAWCQKPQHTFRDVMESML